MEKLVANALYNAMQPQLVKSIAHAHVVASLVQADCVDQRFVGFFVNAKSIGGISTALPSGREHTMIDDPDAVHQLSQDGPPEGR
jgi:hypothetical protein